MGANQRLIVIVVISLVIGSCASIPKESPKLSQEIGQRIAAMQQAHLNLVHKYFDLKRAEVDEIFEEEWIPAYTQSFFSQDQITDYWDNLVTENNKEERVQFLERFAPRMIEEIRVSRAEYMEPLNQLEAQIEDSLQREYRQILSANNTLTSFLTSSSKVAQNRERYLDMFGVEQEEINDYISQADERSEQIMETIREAN